jgi:hypothetical protein
MVDSLHSAFAAKAGVDLVYPLAFDGTLARSGNSIRRSITSRLSLAEALMMSTTS